MTNKSHLYQEELLEGLHGPTLEIEKSIAELNARREFVKNIMSAAQFN